MYWPSSVVAYSPSFDDIAEAFEEGGENLDEEKTKDQLMKEYLSEESLVSYLKWGYLKRNGRKYCLTDLGKEAYYENRELKDNFESS